MKTKIFVFCILSFVLLGCDKEEEGCFVPTLPPITQTGENTIGCHIGDQTFVLPYQKGPVEIPPYALIFWGSPYDDSYNDIDAEDMICGKNARIFIHIMYLDSLGVGRYTVNESNGLGVVGNLKVTNIFCEIWDYEDNRYEIYLSYENSGEINITRYDPENGIVSGTFYCKVISALTVDREVLPKEEWDTLAITDGRFDLDWGKLFR